MNILRVSIWALVLHTVLHDGAHPQATTVFEKNGWRASALVDKGLVTGCVATGALDDKMAMALGKFVDGRWRLVLQKGGGFKPNMTWGMELFVDGVKVHSGEAKVERSGLAILAPELSPLAVNAIAVGHKLQIVTVRGTFDYSLAGTADAIEATENCLAAYAARRPDAPDNGVETGSIDPFLPRATLVGMAGRVLSGAGIRNFKFLPPEDGKKGVVWVTEDGAMGELLAIRPGAKASVDELADLSIEGEAKACKGEFLTGKRPSRYYDGSEIKKVIAKCVSGNNVVASDYSILQLPDGMVVRLTTMTVGTSGAQAPSPSAERLEEAAFRLGETD